MLSTYIPYILTFMAGYVVGILCLIGVFIYSSRLEDHERDPYQ